MKSDKSNGENTTAVQVHSGSQVARVDDYDQQKALAEEVMQRQAQRYGSKHVSSPESYILKFELVKKEDGTIVASPRKKPFKNTSEDVAGMNLMMRSPFADSIGLDVKKRGKYNDEDRLNFNEYGTIEVGEVRAVGSIA